MSSTAEDLIHRHRYTVEDYYRMVEVGILAPDARVELIEGEVIEMPPIGAPHAAVVTDLQNLLIGAVGGDAIVRVQNPVRLGLHDEPQPDIALVKPPASKYRRRHPAAADVLLLIEVVDTSLRYDREVKLPLYGRKGIPETWLLDLVRRELHSLPPAQRDRLHGLGAPGEPGCCPGSRPRRRLPRLVGCRVSGRGPNGAVAAPRVVKTAGALAGGAWKQSPPTRNAGCFGS